MYSEGNEFKNVGFSTLNEILNVVAPPISEHEVIQVWLSHDMEGYDGVESVVYRALARVCLGTHLAHIRTDNRLTDHGTSRGW